MRAKILVVDDEPANRDLLVRALRRKYDVVTASSGKEALELLRGERFAAILSDQRMPNMTGTEFLAEARRLVPETVRMILTGYAPEKDSLDAINLASVSTFLTKPVAAEAVERAVADAVELFEVTRRNAALLEEVAELRHKLATLERREPGAALLDRARFEERLAGELARIERYGGVLALVLCADIEPATLALRTSDLVGRWDDQTLALLLVGTTREGAEAVCRRSAASRFAVAEAPADGRTAGELVAAAESKRS